MAGDLLEFTLTFPNTGQDPASESVITDPVPPGVNYVPGSLRIVAGANVGPKSDSAGNDQAEYDVGTDAVRFRVGAGANASSGGVLAPGASTQVAYRVRVEPDAANTTVSNSAPLAYRAQTIGAPFTYRTAAATIPVTAQANLTLTKISVSDNPATPDTVDAGGRVTSTLTVTNAGPNAATSVVVTDTLPDGVSPVSATWSAGSCSTAGQTITCAVGAVPNGGTVTVTVVSQVDAAFTGDTITNAASVTSAVTDPAPEDNAAAATTTVERAADLRVAKTVAGAGPFRPGQLIEFDVTVSNAGPSVATEVVVTDLPGTEGLTIEGNDNAAACVEDARCEFASLAPGASETVTFRARVAEDFTGGSVSNTASAVSGVPDPNPAAATDTEVVPIAAPQADLVVTKSGDPASVVAGGRVTYEILVSNPDGPSTATAVVLTDTLEDGLTAVSATSERGTCTITGQTVECGIGTLPSAGTATVTIEAVVADTVSGEDLTDSATVTSPTLDPDPDHDTATADTEVTAATDLRIVKTGPPAVAGAEITFTLEVTNDGPSDATGVVVTDELPEEYEFVSAQSPTGPCPDPVAGELSCEIGNLAAGASVSVSVTMEVPPGFTGTAENVASVDGDEPDPNADNNEATFESSGGAQADLSITKSATEPVVAGGQVTWTVTVTNARPSIANDVEVTDDFPAGVSLISATDPCEEGGPGVTCTLGQLDPGENVELTIVGLLAADAEPGPLDNTASVTTSTTDPAQSNDSATTTSEVGTATDLQVTKTVVDLDGQPNPGPYAPGEPFGFLIVITNNGPSVARDVTLFDRENAGLVADIQGDVDEADCEFSTTGELLCDVIDELAPGQSQTIGIGAATLPSAEPGTYENFASVASTTPETDPDNNESEVDFLIGAARADVGLGKTVSPDPLVAGTEFSYTITPTNAGPSTAAGTQIVDSLPPGLIPLDVQTTQGTCSISGQTVTCDIGDVTPALFLPVLGGEVTIVVTGTVATTVPIGVLTNSVTISSTTPDPGPIPNIFRLTTDVVREADLSITKTADDGPAVAGAQVGYTIAVTNAGPSVDDDVIVTDPLPAPLTVVAEGTDARCLPLPTPGQPLICRLGEVGVGDSLAIRVVGTLPADAAVGTLTNVATVSSDTPDPNAENDTATATSEIEQQADLQLTKTADNQTPEAGSEFTYNLVVTNSGPSVARALRLRDDVPPQLTIVDIAEDDALTCSAQGSEVLCTAAELAPGASVVAQVRVRLPETLVAADLENTAQVTSDVFDPNRDRARDTEIVSPIAVANTSITKTKLSPENPRRGDRLVFALDVVNNGPQTAPQVVISDSLATGLSFVSAEVVGGEPCLLTRPEDVDVVTCEVGNLRVGQRARALVTVDAAAILTSITNAASVGSGALDELTDERAANRNFDEITVPLADGPSGPSPTPTPSPTPSPSPTTSPTASSTATPSSPATNDPGGGQPPAYVGTDPGGSSGGLPATGSEVSGWMIAAGILAILGGGVALVLSRRRRE